MRFTFHYSKRLLASLFILLSGLTSNAQDVDVLGLAANLAGQSSELQKTKDELQNRREELKRESEDVKQLEKVATQLKARSSGGRVTVMTRGDVVIRNDNGDTFLHFLERSRRSFASYNEALEAMKPFGLTPESASIRIIDSEGKPLNGPPPKPDDSELRAAESAYANKKSALSNGIQAYQTARDEYDRRLADYNTQVEKLNESLPAAIRDAGSPIPTTAQLNAPKSDFYVDDLKALSEKFGGKPVGGGDALSLLKEATKVPAPASWTKGESVFGATLRAGTAIATFNKDGSYVEGKGSHAAIYITQNKKGIWVYDQYKNSEGQQRPVATRFIQHRGGTASPSNDASSYAVIRKGNEVPDLPKRNR